MTDEEIIETYSDIVLFLARSRTNQPSDAEDVFQEVFLKYIRKKPVFSSSEHAKAWFIKRDHESEDTLEQIPDDTDFLQTIESKAVFEQQLSQIKPRYREVMMLHFDCGFTLREIGRLIGESESNVKALMARGKQQYIKLVMKGADNNE